MVGRYTVSGPAPPEPDLELDGTLRTHYIAADEVEWDYAPLGGQACTQDGSVMPFEEEGSEAALYLGESNGTRIGSRWDGVEAACLLHHKY